MDATTEIRMIRLGQWGHSYPDVDTEGVWECAKLAKLLTDAEWWRVTRAPRHGKRKHIDVMSMCPALVENGGCDDDDDGNPKRFGGSLKASRGLEADCKQVLDEVFRIAMRKEWRFCSLKDATCVSSDPNGPPVDTSFMVSPWVTTSSETISHYTRRDRKRVSACIDAMAGLLDIDRQRTKSGRWRIRVRIVIPSSVYSVNIKAWKNLTEDKKEARKKAAQAPATKPADLHHKYAEVERIDHGVAACDIEPRGRFKVAKDDHDATRRAAGRRTSDEFPASTRRGSYAEQAPDVGIETMSRMTSDARKDALSVGLTHDWVESALNHDPHLLMRLVHQVRDRKRKGKTTSNPAGYVRSEWQRLQRQAASGVNIHAYDDDEYDDEPNDAPRKGMVAS